MSQTWQKFGSHILVGFPLRATLWPTRPLAPAS